MARNTVRRRLDEGETGAKKDQGKFHETMHDGMDPGQISVPSIFDFPSAEELHASLTPTGLLHLVVLPLDFRTLADAVRFAVSKDAKMLAADFHSTSEVACQTLVRVDRPPCDVKECRSLDATRTALSRSLSAQADSSNAVHHEPQETRGASEHAEEFGASASWRVSSAI